jgi:Ca2+-binding EF-hand superfamily protein
LGGETTKMRDGMLIKGRRRTLRPRLKENNMKTWIFAGALVLAAGAAAAATTQHGSRLDVNGDGNVSFTEMQQRMAERFRQMDTDGNGQFTRAEYDAYRAAHPRRGNRPQAQGGDHQQRRGLDFFSRLDADSNGSVSLAEFSAKTTARMQRMDANHDGTVSREEYLAGRQNFGGRHRQDRQND